MGLRVTLGVCALAFGIGGNAWAVAPNYIVIIADDFGSDKMPGPFGWDTSGSPLNLPTTTTLTTLGNAGLRFTNAWANPVCSSTRASINTGVLAWKHDIGDQVKPLDAGLPDVETLAGVLAEDYDYQTALFGKWHLGDTGSPSTSDWTTLDTSPGAVGDVFPPPMGRDDDDDDDFVYPGYGYFDGFLGASVDKEHDGIWPRVYSDGIDWYVESTDVGTHYPDQVIVDSAVAWIDDAVVATGAPPWMAVVALAAPHAHGEGGYTEGDVMADAANCGKLSLSTKPYYICLHNPLVLGADPNICSQAAIYQALVECMDERIGEFLTAVVAPAVGGMSNTIVVFMGDNGTPEGIGAPSLMEAPYSTPTHAVGKDTVYQSGVRVPFIMASLRKYVKSSNPADFITTIGNVTSLVQTWDLYATMIEAADGLNDGDGGGMDSTDLYPCFTGAVGTCASTRVVHYAERFGDDPAFYGEATVGATISGREWSMIATYEPSGCMKTKLYKLSGATPPTSDPHQNMDVSTTNTATCSTLRLMLQSAYPGGDWMPHIPPNIRWCACSCAASPTGPCF
jgi:arylsulfatase A-like enzyme